MTKQEELSAVLEKSNTRMLTIVEEIGLSQKVSPAWTVRDVVAHLSGWDEVFITFLQMILSGQAPAFAYIQNIDEYNDFAVKSRSGLKGDQIFDEFLEKNRMVIDLLAQLPDEVLDSQFTFPWGETGTVEDMVNIFAPHEEEHALELEKILQQATN